MSKSFYLIYNSFDLKYFLYLPKFTIPQEAWLYGYILTNQFRIEPARLEPAATPSISSSLITRLVVCQFYQFNGSNRIDRILQIFGLRAPENPFWVIQYYNTKI